MKSRLFSSSVMTAVVLLLVTCVPMMLAAQSQSQPAKPAATPAAAQMGKAFDTPQQAADAVIKAAADYDVDALMAIFGPDGKDVVSGGDQVQAKNSALEFAKDAQAKNSIVMGSSKASPASVVGQSSPSTTMDISNPDRATIIVGEE